MEKQAEKLRASISKLKKEQTKVVKKAKVLRAAAHKGGKTLR